MRQTATGRWVPDKSPEPQPEPRYDLSYDSYFVHIYAHPDSDQPRCGWCQGRTLDPGPPPWDALQAVRLS